LRLYFWRRPPVPTNACVKWQSGRAVSSTQFLEPVSRVPGRSLPPTHNHWLRVCASTATFPLPSALASRHQDSSQKSAALLMQLLWAARSCKGSKRMRDGKPQLWQNSYLPSPQRLKPAGASSQLDLGESNSGQGWRGRLVATMLRTVSVSARVRNGFCCDGDLSRHCSRTAAARLEPGA